MNESLNLIIDDSFNQTNQLKNLYSSIFKKIKKMKKITRF